VKLNRNPFSIGRTFQAASLALMALSSIGCGAQSHPLGSVTGSGQANASAWRAAAPGGATGGALRLITLPEAGDAFFLRALHQARTTIRLQVYLLTHDGVIAELIAARARGVEVQVILEQTPFNEPKISNPANPKAAPVPANQLAAAKLASGGVTVTWSSDAFTFTHAKALTIDDQVTFVSTANFTRSGLAMSGTGSREYMIEDRAPGDVAEFVGLFKADRAHTPYQPANPALVVSPVNARQKLMALIGSAKHDVAIQVEVAGDPALDALIATKCHEGVQVRAMLAEMGSHKGPGSGANATSARAWMQAGAQVRYQDTPHLHAKAIVVDGATLYVGSVNLTTTSMDQNRELGLLVSQADIVNGVRQTFEHDWAGARPTSKRAPLKAPKMHRHHLVGIGEEDIYDDSDDIDTLDEDPI
jgi:cardiolipin synthase